MGRNKMLSGRHTFSFFAFGSLLLAAITVSVFPVVANAVDTTEKDKNLPLAIKSEIPTDDFQPIISLEEVINPATPMEGDYPIQTYGSYGGLYFWMDNHRLIFNPVDKEKNLAAIESWDVVTGEANRYGWGKILCYAEGRITKVTYVPDAPTKDKWINQSGYLGKENESLSGGVKPGYNSEFECGEKSSQFISTHRKEHPEDLIVALRPEHGFIVRAKLTFLPDGRTGFILEQDYLAFHAPNKAPVYIPMIPWLEGKLDAYYPFVRAYAFKNGVKGEKDPRWSSTLRHRRSETGEIVQIVEDENSKLSNSAFILSVNGEYRKVKVPDFFIKGYGATGPYLTKQGLVWFGESVIPNNGNGIYLSRGEQIRQISSENVHGGKVSPDGCRIAYTSTSINFFGRITDPTLKIMNLCKGEK